MKIFFKISQDTPCLLIKGKSKLARLARPRSKRDLAVTVFLWVSNMYILLTPANNPHTEGFAVLEDR